MHGRNQHTSFVPPNAPSRLTPAHAGEEITSPARTRVSKVGSNALAVALIEAQSLRSHTLYLLIKCANFLIKPRVLRFRRIAAAQLFERFLNGEFGGFSHGNPNLRCFDGKAGSKRRPYRCGY